MKFLCLFLLSVLRISDGFSVPRPSAAISSFSRSSSVFPRDSLWIESSLSASATDAPASKEPWTPPRRHNSPWIRSAALLTVLTLASQALPSSSLLLSTQSLSLIHLLSFATWFGAAVYTTFIAGITMFQNLPKKVFGKLQAKLFPKYFGLSSVCLILQLASLSALAKSNNKVVLLGLWQRSQPVLVASLCLTLLNQFVWEPIATHNMLERYRMEDDNLATSEEYTKLKKSFGKYHGLSSLTNLLALCGGVAHAVYLAAALVV